MAAFIAIAALALAISSTLRGDGHLGQVRDAVTGAVEILAAGIALVTLGVLIAWLSRDDKSCVVLPFENPAGIPGCGGRAISDSLTAEVIRIEAMQSGPLDTQVVNIELLTPPRLRPDHERLNVAIEGLGTVDTGRIQISIGRLLLILRQLWPIGQRGAIITGGIQRYGTSLQIVARQEGRDNLKAWAVSRKDADLPDIPAMVRELAYRIVKDLSPDVVAKTWDGLMNFNEACRSYAQYQQTQQRDLLAEAAAYCISASSCESHYPMLPALMYYIGFAFYDISDYAAARDVLRCAMNVDPDAVDTYELLAVVLIQLSAFDEAARAARRALDLDPDDFHAMCQLGRIEQRRFRYNEAIRYYLDALKLKPPPAEAYVQAYAGLSSSYRRLGRDDAALRFAKRAVKIDPTDKRSHRILAYAWLRRQQLTQAAHEFRLAASAVAHSAFASHVYLAVIDRARGRDAEALGHAEEAISLFDATRREVGSLEGVDLCEMGALMTLMLGDVSDAMTMLDSALTMPGVRPDQLLSLHLGAYDILARAVTPVIGLSGYVSKVGEAP